MLNKNGNFLGMLVLVPSGHLSANILSKNLAYPEETITLSKFHHRDALIPWPQRVIKEKSSILLQKGPQIKPKLVTVNFPNDKKKGFV